MTKNEISEKIIGCAIQVHRELGPGLLESSYEKCFYFELIQAGLLVVALMKDGIKRVVHKL